MSDSSYAALTRHRRPLSTAGRPPALDVIDDIWASDTLSDDEIDVERHEAVIAPMLEEGDLDVDAVVVSVSTGQSAADRKRKEEGRWNDLAMDYFENGNGGAGAGAGNSGAGGGNGGAEQGGQGAGATSPPPTRP